MIFFGHLITLFFKIQLAQNVNVGIKKKAADAFVLMQ